MCSLMIYEKLKSLKYAIIIVFLVPAIGGLRVSLNGMKYCMCTIGLFFMFINEGEMFFCAH